MKLALAQMKMDREREKNLNCSLALLEQAGKEQADLIFYPEVQLSPFFAQFPRCPALPDAITKEDPAFAQFRDACRKSGILASPNFYYRENGKNYDTSFLIDKDGKMLGTQKMVHIAQAPQFYEQDYYTPSDDGFHVFDTAFGKIGIVVCFDRHYPESIRTEALMGADLILIPTANTRAEPMELFEQEIRVQAFQNCCYIAMCNRTGTESQMEFAGESLVVDPDGNTIAKAGSGEELLFAEINLNRAEEARNARPYLSLRRTDCYL